MHSLANEKIKSTTFNTLNNKPVTCEFCKKIVWSFNIVNHYKVFHPGPLKEENVKHAKAVEKFKSDYNKEVARKLEKQKKQEKRKLKGGAQPKNKRRKLGKS